MCVLFLLFLINAFFSRLPSHPTQEEKKTFCVVFLNFYNVSVWVQFLNFLLCKTYLVVSTR